MNIKSWILGLGVAAAMSFPTAIEAHVLDGAQEYNGHYYKNFDFTLSWKKAGEFCRSMGGHLATMESLDEALAVENAIRQGSQESYWVGGYRDRQSLWRWITGGTITSAKWGGGHPKKNSKFQWMRIGRIDKRWRSDAGKKPHGFICEWESAADAHDSNM